MSIRAHVKSLWNPDDLLDSLWGILASSYVTMLLLLSLAALVCLSILLPQRSAQTIADSTVNNLWLASVRERYGSATDWLQSLGLFDIARSAGLRGMLGLLAFNLVLATVDAIRPRYRWHSAENTRTLTGTCSPEETEALFTDRVQRAIQAQGYRVSRESNGQLFHAQRFAFFPVLVYVGLALVVAGAALSERTAWWEKGVGLRPGQTRPLGHGTGLTLRAEVVASTENDPAGSSQEAHLVANVLKADQEIGRLTLDAQAPSFCAGLLFYPTSAEPALLVQAQDTGGGHLTLQTPEMGAAQSTELALRFQEPESQRYIVTINLAPGSPLQRYFQQKGNEQYVLVPTRDLTLRLQYNPPSSGESAAVFRVEAYHDAETTPFFEQQFQGTRSIEIEGDLYSFTPYVYTIIQFGQDYGMALVLLGAVMALVGITLSTLHPPQRAWLLTRLTGNQVTLLIAPENNLDVERANWLNILCKNLTTELSLNPAGVL